MQHRSIDPQLQSAMSVSNYFSPVAKILTQSGYANSQQIEQAVIQFQEAGKSLTDESSLFLEIIESITGNNIPKHIRQNLLLCLNFFSEEYPEPEQVKENRVISNILSELPDEIELNSSNTDNSQVIALTNKILAKALQDSIYDIHIEPLEYALRIRFRKDGSLYQAFDLLPKKIAPAIVSRFKVMANLDIRERRIAQTGKSQFQWNFQGNSIYLQVSTLPSRYGEKIVLRIFNEGQIQLNLAESITDHNTLATVKKLVNSASGLILVTSSTGDNLTTLYSILAERNNPDVNIVTVEELIKFSLPGITQVMALPEKGTDFVSILRSFMNQDPDIVLVSNLREQETAKTTIELARRDCLVLAGFQANDAASAITNLVKMNIEPYQISNSLSGVIAQRLMRRVCECRLPYTPSDAELTRFGLSPSLAAIVTLYKAKTLRNEELAEAKQQDTICKQCNGTGYKGTISIYEVLPNTNGIQTLILEGASYAQIKEAAVAEGMTTLLTYSLNLVQQGYTTLEEVERLIFNDAVLDTELQVKQKIPLSPDVKKESQLSDPSQRIQELEKQLAALITQFEQLKKELKS